MYEKYGRRIYAVYEKLVKGYTEKQWGRDCKELPAFIIKRLPLRFTYDNNYFNDPYQGIPIGGYTQIVEKMLHSIEVKTGVSYQEYIESAPVGDNGMFTDKQGNIFSKVLYTGMIDDGMRQIKYYFFHCSPDSRVPLPASIPSDTLL